MHEPKHVGLVCYKEFIADHVTFRWRVYCCRVILIFQTFEHSREPLCEWLEKAIVRRVIAS